MQEYSLSQATTKLLGIWLLVSFVFGSIAPPFYAPDETLHATWAARYFTGQDPTQGQACSELEKPIHSFAYEETYRKGAGEISRSMTDPAPQVTQELCQKAPYSGSYVSWYMYWPTLLVFLLKFKWTATVYLTRFLQIAFLGLLLYRLNKKLQPITPAASVSLIGGLALFSLPLTIQQTFSNTTDYNILLACIAMIGLSYSQILRRWEVLLLLFFLLVGALSKPGFLPLLFGLGWIQYKNQTSAHRRFICAAFAFIAAAVFARGLYYVVAGTNTAMPEVATNVALQKQFILQHPLRTLITLLKSGWGKTFSMAGTRLGWLSTPIPRVSYIFANIPTLVFFSMLYKVSDRGRMSFKRWNRATLNEFTIHFISAAGFIVLTGLGLYILNSKPGEDKVLGLQARYYFPLATYFILILARFCPYSSAPKLSKRMLWLFGSAVVLNCLAIFIVLLQRYPIQ